MPQCSARIASRRISSTNALLFFCLRWRLSDHETFFVYLALSTCDKVTQTDLNTRCAIFLTFCLSLSLSQFYDLGSPADSFGSTPGCLMTDSSCVNMGFPSCGTRGRCHGEWGSFSCQCIPGYSGHQCEKGNYLAISKLLKSFSVIFKCGR